MLLFLFGSGTSQSINRQPAPDQLEYRPVRLPPNSFGHLSPRRDSITRILAIRVEFVRDSLATTSGEGEFAYSETDPLYDSFADTTIIFFDPPPHDSLYFTDHLEFLRFYWEKMSTGAYDVPLDGQIVLEWSIYPAGERAAYRLPKQMWRYNWNYTEEQLDRGLAELFRDAVTAADTDTAIMWQDYDLVMIFHAGAGAEFDLGYTTTPHDLPSAWMVREDFELINLNDGIPVDEGAFHVPGGLILPETESHEGVQISMTGVICSLFGHWLGLPALYDRDNGDPVVGKWSLMDRGFGNFYGAIPGQLDAWSRSYMGWIEPVDINQGDWTIAAMGFLDYVFSEAYRIPISANEYFLLECRSRDPENDSVAVAYDRDGRQMIFNEDYTVTPDPGFRVPVWIDNLDFDAPGSGILIWHVDESVSHLIPEGRFNSIDELRGLDLEEADGAQDIGRNYPFLTPGYGTDYGIFADAWFFNNQYHQDANEGRQVSFNNNSYPGSRANSGAATNITIDNFSRRDSVMTFTYTRQGFQFDEPIAHGFERFPHVVTGNFDDNPRDEEFVLMGRETVRYYDGTGDILHTVPLDTIYNNYVYETPVIRDLDFDGLDEIIWIGNGDGGIDYLNLLLSDAAGNFSFTTVDSIDGYFPEFSVGGSIESPVLCLAYNLRQLDPDSSETILLDSNLERLGYERFEGRLLSLHRFGTAASDTFLLVTENGTLYFWFGATLVNSGNIDDNSSLRASYVPLLADMDGSGQQDLLYFCYDYIIRKHVIATVHDPALNGTSEITKSPLFYNFLSSGSDQGPVPADIDNDGQYELVAFGSRGTILALEGNGNVADGFPLRNITPADHRKGAITFADVDDNGEIDFLYLSESQTSINESPRSRDIVYSYAIDAISSRGRRLPGFPIQPRIDISTYSPTRVLCQLDDDPQLELLLVSADVVDALELNAGGLTPNIWWQGLYRDNDHSNAIWEPGSPVGYNPGDPLLPADLCYNWPNPARSWTSIRYTLNFPATVKVDVFDIAGERVTTLHGSGDVGVPNEIIWYLSGIPRGGYIALVKAEGSDRSETRTVKIAVIK